MEDLISIIIPIYNVENYLEQCLNSVIAQTYNNIEIILIDDGSIDDSGNICDEYKSRDSRIKVIHKKNEGIGKTRNLGVKTANGKYIAFIDSDDKVKENYIEKLYESIKATNADIVQCSFYIVKKDKLLYKKEKYNKKEIFTSVEAINNLFYEKNINSSIWCKLFDKEIFNDFEFLNIKKFEDFDAVYKLIKKSNKICYIDNKLYYYYVRKNSLMTSNFTKDNYAILDIMNSIQTTKKTIKSYNHRRLCMNFYFLRNIEKNDINYNRIKHEIIKERTEVFKDKNCSEKAKVGIIISYISISSIRLIYKIYDIIINIKYSLFGKNVNDIGIGKL